MAFDVPTRDEFFEAVRHPVRWYRDGGPDNPFEAEVRQKRIRLVGIALGFLLVVGIAFGVYEDIATREARSEKAYLEGERLLRPNSYQDAISKFDRSISLNGKNEKSHLARGEALAQLGNKAEALKAFNRVIELNPKWARGFAARGKLRRDSGETQKALDDLNISVQLEENPENLLERGQAFAALGQWENAIADYTLYIKLRDGVPYPYTLRAIARMNLGDEAGAKEDKIQALVYEGKLSLYGTTSRKEAPSAAGDANKPPKSNQK